MHNREQVAVEVLKCALSWEPEVRLLGNVMASEIAALAASCVTSCPSCGAEPFVNIDCDVCTICRSLLAG